jgi:hypothetical protein
MIVVSDPASVDRIVHPGVRSLVRLRIDQVRAGEPFDSERHGRMIVAEPGDSAEALEAACGVPLLRDWEDIPFGHEDFAPPCEVLEEHADCFELGFVLNDDGFFVALFVPKGEGVDAQLLAMCAQFAVPAPDLMPP